MFSGDNDVVQSFGQSPPAIRVFGPMKVRFGQLDVPLGSPRQRALFAVLLINVGKTVSVHDIISSIWGPSPSTSVMGTLHSYVSRLRKAISETMTTQHEVLVSMRHAGPGYQLDISPDDTDVHRFESLVEFGRVRLAAGDLTGAHHAMDQALALWTDTPYGELAAYDFATLEATRLEQLRLQGLQIWADSCLGLGSYDEVVRELGREIRHNPMLERLGSRLMLAQYHSGSPAEALLTYEQIRSHLSAELGADTSKELQEIHQAILRQDLPACRPGPPRESRPAQRPGAGSREVTVAQPRAAKSAPPMGSLVGREQELAQLRSLVAGERPMRTVLVTGEQGVGKTRFLKELEKELAATDREVIWAHCAGAGASARRMWHQVVRKVLRARGGRLEAPVGELPGAFPAREHDRPSEHDTGRLTHLDDTAYQHAVVQLLLAAAGKPVVLMLEDLHLADAYTMQLLHLLTVEVPDARLVVIATVREHCLALRPELRRAVADLLRTDAVGNLHLTGLSPVEAHALIHELHGAPVPWYQVSFLHRAAGGNPYLLTGLAKLKDLTGIHKDLLGAVPFAVRTVLECRLAEYPAEVIAVLEVCAVMGPVIDHYLVNAVLTQRRMTGSVNDALQTGLLTRNPDDPGDLRFSQYLVREHVLAGLDTMLRAQVHLAIAQALADATAHGSRWVVGPDIGHHCAQAAKVLDPTEAVRPMVALADRAEGQRRQTEAWMWLAQASAVLRARPLKGGAAQAERALRERMGRLTAGACDGCRTQSDPGPGRGKTPRGKTILQKFPVSACCDKRNLVAGIAACLHHA